MARKSVSRRPAVRVALPAALCLLGACLSGGALEPPAAAAEAPASGGGGRELSRAQATAIVEHRYAARVVRTSSVEEDGRHLYVFRLLSPAGKVWEVRIDARSGEEVH